MTKTLLSILGLSLISVASIAQCGTQFTLKPAATPNAIEVWVKTDFTDPEVRFSKINFTLSIEKNGTILTQPVVEDLLIADLPFSVSAPFTDNNPTSRIFYDISAVNNNADPESTAPMAVTANTEFKVVTVSFGNGTGNSIIQLNDFSNGDGISIPSGGLSGNARVNASIVTNNGFGCDGAGTITNTIDFENMLYSVPGKSTIGQFGAADFVATLISVPLPVTITSFTAQNLKNSAAMLNWNVAQEEGMATYEVEHSTDGARFNRSVGIMAANGSSQYAIADNAPVAGDNYYRLKATGKDGKTSFMVRKVAFDAPSRIAVSPTLTNGTINIVLPELYQDAKIDVINAMGQTVAATIDGSTINRTVSLSGHAAGLYILRIQAGNHVENHRIQLTN